jgi:ATP-dependent DNA helicase RecG
MNSLMEERGLPHPIYEEDSGAFVVTFNKEVTQKESAQKIGGIKVPEKVTENIIEQVRRKFGEKFGESSEKILKIILADKKISAQEIAKQMNISSRAVEKHIANLKKYGILKRIGPDKGGYWEVIKKIVETI